jgi:hypothetical protein
MVYSLNIYKSCANPYLSIENGNVPCAHEALCTYVYFKSGSFYAYSMASYFFI